MDDSTAAVSDTVLLKINLGVTIVILVLLFQTVTRKEFHSEIKKINERIMDSTAIRNGVTLVPGEPLQWLQSGKEFSIQMFLKKKQGTGVSRSASEQFMDQTVMIATSQSVFLHVKQTDMMGNGVILGPDLLATALHVIFPGRTDSIGVNVAGRPRTILLHFHHGPSEESNIRDVAVCRKMDHDFVLVRLTESIFPGKSHRVRSHQNVRLVFPFKAISHTWHEQGGEFENFTTELSFNGMSLGGLSVFTGPGRSGHSGTGVWSSCGSLVGIVTKAHGPASRTPREKDTTGAPLRFAARAANVYRGLSIWFARLK